MATWIDRELAAFAKRRRGAPARTGPRAIAAVYSPGHDMVVVDLDNGAKFAFPPGLAQGLADAPVDALSEIAITPGGDGLLWERIGVALSVTGLLAGVFGGEAWTRELAARGGRVSTPAKARAARINGAKGGRNFGLTDSREPRRPAGFAAPQRLGYPTVCASTIDCVGRRLSACESAGRSRPVRSTVARPSAALQ
jgi:hypothetical protein